MPERRPPTVGEKPGARAAAEFRRAWDRHFRPKRPMTIEGLLTWTYRDQRVIEITGRALFAAEASNERWVTEGGTSGDGCYQIERNAILGCTVDGGGPVRGIAQPLHEDAEKVHEIVMSLPWHQSGQLVFFGRTGNAPEPPPRPRLKRVVIDDGRRWRVKLNTTRDFALNCQAQWCPVVLDPDPAAIERQADVFQAWLDALEGLLIALDGVELKDHEILGIGTVGGPDG